MDFSDFSVSLCLHLVNYNYPLLEKLLTVSPIFPVSF